MFQKIKRIKDVRLLNATLKEARLRILHEESVEKEKQALQSYLDFKGQREIEEESLVNEVLGKVVLQADIDLMNEKINVLRNEESNLAIEHQDRISEERKAYSDWSDSVEQRLQSQRKVDKLEIVCEMEEEELKAAQQIQEDMELEEFKSIVNSIGESSE